MTQDNTTQGIPTVDLRKKAKRVVDYQFEDVTIRVEKPSLGRLSEIIEAQNSMSEVDETDEKASFNAVFKVIKLLAPSVTKAQVQKLTIMEINLLIGEVVDGMQASAEENAKKK